jgi:hypothetical protein
MVRVARHQPADEVGQFGRHLGAQGADRLGVVEAVAQQLRRPVAAGERHPAGEEEVEGAAQAVQVGAGGAAVAAHAALGGHEVHRAAQLAVAAGRAGQAEVEQLDHRPGLGALAGQHEVGGLHVAMHQPAVVQVGQRQRRLAGHLARQGDRQRPRLADQPPQVRAIDVLQHQHQPAAQPGRVVGGDDVRVVEPAARLHLGAPRGAALRGRPGRRQRVVGGGQGRGDRRGAFAASAAEDLQDDQPPEEDVLGLVHRAALAEAVEQAVGAEAQPAQPPGGGLLGLVGRQQAGLHQRVKVRPDRAVLAGGAEAGDLVVVEQTGRAEQGEEVIGTAGGRRRGGAGPHPWVSRIDRPGKSHPTRSCQP